MRHSILFVFLFLLFFCFALSENEEKQVGKDTEEKIVSPQNGANKVLMGKREEDDSMDADLSIDNDVDDQSNQDNEAKNDAVASATSSIPSALADPASIPASNIAEDQSKAEMEKEIKSLRKELNELREIVFNLNGKVKREKQGQRENRQEITKLAIEIAQKKSQAAPDDSSEFTLRDGEDVDVGKIFQRLGRLNEKIRNEVTDRTNAVAALQAAITQEISDRTSQYNELYNQVDNVNNQYNNVQQDFQILTEVVAQNITTLNSSLSGEIFQELSLINNQLAMINEINSTLQTNGTVFTTVENLISTAISNANATAYSLITASENAILASAKNYTDMQINSLNNTVNSELTSQDGLLQTGITNAISAFNVTLQEEFTHVIANVTSAYEAAISSAIANATQTIESVVNGEITQAIHNLNSSILTTLLSVEASLFAQINTTAEQVAAQALSEINALQTTFLSLLKNESLKRHRAFEYLEVQLQQLVQTGTIQSFTRSEPVKKIGKSVVTSENLQD